MVTHYHLKLAEFHGFQGIIKGDKLISEKIYSVYSGLQSKLYDLTFNSQSNYSYRYLKNVLHAQHDAG